MIDEPELEHNDQEEGSEMDDVSLLGVIEQLEGESYGFASGDLQNQRAYAIERYLCEPFGDEVDGRSSVVSTELRDRIEWALPQILRVFLAGDEIVEFQPVSPEDEPGAKLETQYVNHIMLEKNDAFNVFSTWFRDALMAKVGYVKAYWQERQDILSESYEGVGDEGLAMIAHDQSVQIVQHESYPDPYYVAPPMPAPQAMQQGMVPGMTPPPVPMVHNIKLRRVHQCGNVKIDNVPPEEIRVHRSLRTINMQDAIFVQHSTYKTLSELRQDGYEIPDYIAGGSRDDAGSSDEVRFARDRFADDEQWADDNGSADPSLRRIWVRESYLRVDYDGDGIAELRKVCHAGNTILNRKDGTSANEETDIIPFAAVTPIIFPHKHVGLGFDDLLEQHIVVDTALKRGYLDNLYLKNNGRYGVDVTKVNIDDMLTSRPGGIVRINGNPNEAMMPFVHQDGGASALEGMNMLQQWAVASSGIAVDQANMSADVLQGVTATATSQVVSAGQARVEAITRSFATGVKELVGIVHALTLTNATGPERLKLNSQWTTIDPREWVKRTNMNITVGLGTGTKETRVHQLQMLAQMQAQGVQAGIVTPANLYHTGTRITQEMGYRNNDEFWTDPSKQPPKPPQPPPEIAVEQMRQQGKQQEMQANGQIEMQKIQAQSQAKQQEMAAAQEVQRSNDQRDTARLQLDAQLKREEFMARIQAEDVQHQRAQETAIRIAWINAQAKTEAARVAAMTPDPAVLGQEATGANG